MNRKDFFNYLIKEYFNNDLDQVEQLTGYTKAQIEKWRREDGPQPQRDPIDRMIRCAVVPEPKIIVEFEPLPPSSRNDNFSGFLRRILGEFKDAPGSYSFYDSAVNILYIGKTNNKLQTEMNQALGRDITATLSGSIQNIPKKHYEVVRYVSAYYVSAHARWKTCSDYAKIIEALFLRIAKPPLNKTGGKLLDVDGSGMRTRTNA